MSGDHLRRVVRQLATLFVCGFLPLLALFYAIGPVAFGDLQAADFHFAFYPAAQDVLAGRDFYPLDGFVIRGEDELVIDYVYPPLVALLTIPWTVMPLGLAEVLFQLVLVAAVAATLIVLDVRDWRCYGVAFLWPPVTDAVTTGNVSILLGLCAALVWRFRDRAAISGAALGASIAAKIFLWPLTIWLAAGRRYAGALWSVAVALVALVGSWAIVGFHGLAEYPEIARRLGERLSERGYTAYALGLDLGLPASLAWVLWASLAAGLLVASAVLTRRGDDRRGFVLGLAAAIACSPIVWLHYFALLIVVVAVARPRLAPIWFVGLPLQLFVTTGVYNGSTLQTASVLLAAAVTVGLALAPPGERTGAQLFGRARIVSSSPR